MVGMLLFSSILVRGEEEATLQTCYVLMTPSVDEFNWTRWKGPRRDSLRSGNYTASSALPTKACASSSASSLRQLILTPICHRSIPPRKVDTGCNRSGAPAHSAAAELAGDHKSVHGHRLVS